MKREREKIPRLKARSQEWTPLEGGLLPHGRDSDLAGDSTCRIVKNFAGVCEAQRVHSSHGNRKHPAGADGPRLVGQCAESWGTGSPLANRWQEPWCPYPESYIRVVIRLGPSTTGRDLRKKKKKWHIRTRKRSSFLPNFPPAPSADKA